MKERRRFRPTTVDWLETRVVLNASAHIAPVSPGHVTTNARNAATQAVVNNVNLSFDSFTTDYLQAQGTYFAAGPTGGSYCVQAIRRPADPTAGSPIDPDLHARSRQSEPVESLDSWRPRHSPNVLEVGASTARRIGLYASHCSAGNGGAVPPVGTNGTTATLYTDRGNHRYRDVADFYLNSVGFLYSRSFQKH